MVEALRTDVLVVGAGGAGMYAALAASRGGADRVILVDKNIVGRGGATIMAQMTVAAALAEETPDAWENHLEDTLVAGRGLCDETLAELVCHDAPIRMREMENWRVGWARGESGRIRQVMAPGHGVPRCCYVDFLNTGPAVAATLRRQVSRNGSIRRLSNVTITDPLLTGGRCIGMFGYDMATGQPVAITAGATIIATGGLTSLYARTSASANMAGEGYALALAAGADLVDMEFVQFFPIGHLAPRLVGMDPIMWDPFRYKLGGRLLNGEMREFMEAYGNEDSGTYKAPRDLATYAITKEVEAGRGTENGGVYLSFQHIPEDKLREAFGPVIERLAGNGIDLCAMPVEVAPIAHYHMGGIKVDHSMQTTVPGLFAAGEAVGGASGANRLSGNAISEALVFGEVAGRGAAASLAKGPDNTEQLDVSRPLETFRQRTEEADGRLWPSAAKRFQDLREMMWRSVGPFRNQAGLLEALDIIRVWRRELAAMPPSGPADGHNGALGDWYQLRAALSVAESVTLAAMMRKESRGAHQREDYEKPECVFERSQAVRAGVGGEIEGGFR